MQVPLIRLKCGCNSYEWGKTGNHSAAAKYAAATGFQIEQDKPYAELWMGTHPSLPSTDVETGRSLIDMVQDNKALLSQDVAKRYGEKLPFLFKVLSITKALSIQAHPNKKLAEELHQDDPEHYPDDNHKPEMTIAITPFDGFCGFRPLGEISHFLQTVEPLKELIGKAVADEFVSTVSGKEKSDNPDEVKTNKKVLQKAFSSLMNNATSASDDLSKHATALVDLAKSSGDKFADDGGPSPSSGRELSDLIVRLDSQFPADVGLFVLFFLNYVKLEVGEAMFLRADDIHAYLSGDIIECMASSDNVVRAGFTPKFKDVRTLTDMLTYSYAPIEEQKMSPVDFPYVKLSFNAWKTGSSSILYDPPIEEFSVVKTELNDAGSKATFEAIDGPSIIICTKGEGKISVGPKVEEMKEGYVYFVGATAELVLESTSESFTTFKAFCELEDEPPATNGKM